MHGTPSSVFSPDTTVPESPFGPGAPAGPGGPGSPLSPFAPATFQLTACSRRRHWVDAETCRSQPPDGCLQAWITVVSPESCANATPAIATATAAAAARKMPFMKLPSLSVATTDSRL